MGVWAKRQRRQYALGTLPADRVAALKGIDFDFKPGRSTKKERLAIQLGLLDALRKRRELTNAQVADLNYLYDEWKRRAEEGIKTPVHGNKLDDMSNKFNVRWMQKFEELKEFQVCDYCFHKLTFSVNKLNLLDLPVVLCTRLPRNNMDTLACLNQSYGMMLMVMSIEPWQNG